MPAIAETKRLVADWILITYDLPIGQDEESRKRNAAFRAYWIYNARKLGAMMHTESSYLMPFTVEGIKLAREIAEKAGGQVFIWASKLTEPKEAKGIAIKYDDYLESYFEEMEERVKEAEEAVTNGELDNRAVVQKLKGMSYFIEMCDQVIARRGDKTLETRFRAYQAYIPKIRQAYERRREAQEAAKAQKREAAKA